MHKSIAGQDQGDWTDTKYYIYQKMVLKFGLVQLWNLSCPGSASRWGCVALLAAFPLTKTRYCYSLWFCNIVYLFSKLGGVFVYFWIPYLYFASVHIQYLFWILTLYICNWQNFLQGGRSEAGEQAGGDLALVILRCRYLSSISFSICSLYILVFVFNII